MIELDEFNAFPEDTQSHIIHLFEQFRTPSSFLVLTFNPISASIKNRFDISPIVAEKFRTLTLPPITKSDIKCLFKSSIPASILNDCVDFHFRIMSQLEGSGHQPSFRQMNELINQIKQKKISTSETLAPVLRHVYRYFIILSQQLESNKFRSIQITQPKNPCDFHLHDWLKQNILNSHSAIINHIATTLPKSKPEILTTIIDSNIDYLTENTDLHSRVIRHIQRCLYRQFNLPHEKFFTVHEIIIATHSSIQFDHNLARFIRNLYNYNDLNYFWMITTIKDNKDMIPKIYTDDFIITNVLFDVTNTSVALVSISNNPNIEENFP